MGHHLPPPSTHFCYHVNIVQLLYSLKSAESVEEAVSAEDVGLERARDESSEASSEGPTELS